jgi:uncharacterized protein YqeY
VSFLEQLDADFKAALKSRDDIKVSALRMLKAALQNKTIAKMGPLTDDDMHAVLSSLCKQRKESIEQFTAAQREDLAEKEKKELALLQLYLPKQLSPEELDAIIKSAINETGAVSLQDVGRVMKLVIQRTRGVADGSIVNQKVRELLTPRM